MTNDAGSTSLPAMISGTVLLLAILGGIFVLAWHKTLTGVEVLGVLSTIVGIAGGAFAVHSGVSAAGKASARTIEASKGRLKE